MRSPVGGFLYFLYENKDVPREFAHNAISFTESLKGILKLIID